MSMKEVLKAFVAEPLCQEFLPSFRQEGNYDYNPELSERNFCLDRCKTIGNIAFLIITLSSIVLMAYFHHHPMTVEVPKLVSFLPSFSINVPILVYVAGSACSFILLIKLLRVPLHILLPFLRNNLHGGIVDDERDTLEDWIQKHRDTVKEDNGKFEVTSQYTTGPETRHLEYVSYETLDKDKFNLNGIWMPQAQSKNAKTVILFHGTNNEAYGMYVWARYYHERGFHVLMAEYREYGNSQGTKATRLAELHALLDAEAALNFVLGKEIEKKDILAHGMSLGGYYAAALGDLGVETIVLERTFTKAYRSGKKEIKNLLKKNIPEKLVQFVFWLSYSSGSAKSREGIKLKTNGWDTAARIERMKGEIFVISAKDDEMMPAEGHEELLKACYKKRWQEIKEERHAAIDGEHKDYPCFMNDDNKDARQKLDNFLKSRHLLEDNFEPKIRVR